MRFVFAGDTHIGERVSKNLTAAGHDLAASIQDAEVILTYSITQGALEDMYFDTDGILQLASEGSCFIDLSPSTPSFGVELYALAQTKNCQAIDAPLTVKDLTNHDAYADRASLGMMVGCEEKVFAQYEPMLKAIASTVCYAGINGEGQRAKAFQTIQLAGSLVAVFEAWTMNNATNTNPLDALRYAVQMGVAAPAVEAVYTAICDQHFHGTYSAQALMSELAAVMQAADDAEIMLPQTESAAQLVEFFLMAGGAEKPVSAISLVYAEEEDSKKFGMDWGRAQAMMTGKENEYEHECQCGHDPNDPNHECCGKHHHHHHEGAEAEYVSDDEYDSEYDGYGYDPDYGSNGDDIRLQKMFQEGQYPSEAFFGEMRDDDDDYDPYDEEYPSQSGLN